MNRCALLAAVAVCAGLSLGASAQQSSAFTYQGRVTDSGAPMNGTVNLQLSLWKDAVSGSVADRIGNVQTLSNVPVSNGVFTVVANSLSEFGANPFSGEARWLQVSVNGVTVLPRQQLRSMPYASGLVSGGGAVGNSTTVRTLSLINQNTSQDSSAASTLYVQRGSASGLSVPFYGPSAVRIETDSGAGLLAATSTGASAAVVGASSGNGATGVAGYSTGDSANGLYGRTTGSAGTAVFGYSTGDSSYALVGRTTGTSSTGVIGWTTGAGSSGVTAIATGPSSFALQALSSGSDSKAAYLEGRVDMVVATGQTLEFRFDQFVPMINVNNPGANAGHMRLRNALEIWPSTDSARAGFLDVRNTAGVQTITLNGANGNIVATGTITPSSRRLKDHITPISDALEKLMRIEGVRYDWIAEEAAKRAGKVHDLGFIAEEVDEQFPEIVARDESGKVVGMDYTRMTAVAVQAIKQLKAEHEKQVEALRAENAALQARMERLERAIGQGR
ncbi:MAG: tail fiber domain-containing protein [Phycisphaerales bacterium]